MSEYISSISNDALSTLCEELRKNNHINPDYYNRFEVESGYEVVEIYASMGGKDITHNIDNRGAGVYIIDLGQVDGDLYFRFTTQPSSIIVPVEYLDVANNVLGYKVGTNFYMEDPVGWTMIFLMPSFGLVQGMQPIVGFNYGAKQYG